MGAYDKKEIMKDIDQAGKLKDTHPVSNGVMIVIAKLLYNQLYHPAWKR